MTETRRAVAADAPRLGALGALLVELHHDFDPQRFLPGREGLQTDYASFLIRQLADASVVLLVAADGARVLGYAYARAEGYDYKALRGPAGVLHDLVVDPAYRRRGVGRSLVDATLAELRARGVPRVVLSTAARNEAAQRLYASVGFRTTMIEMTREPDGPA